MATSFIPNYGTATYSLLCYAKMRKTEFGVEDIKNCIPGRFGKPKMMRTRILESASVLVKHGFIDLVGTQRWLVTEPGINAISISVARYRDQRERLLGRRYVSSFYDRMSKVASTTIFSGINEYFDDEEEALLIEIEDKFRKANSKKKKPAGATRPIKASY